MEAPLLTIEGKDYIFVKTRSHMPVSIYKGDGCYLRIGPPELIQGEIDYHRSLLEFGFPIPTILTTGEHLGYGYFIESSLGDEHFGEIFARTCTSDCTVSDTEFEKLLAIVEKFLSAQLKTINLKHSTPELFRRLIQLDTVTEELPELEVGTREAMARIENRIQSLPSVLTHGDFNPFNILEGGVIDWERGSYTPLGYDLTSNITQTFFFPLGGDFEYTASYRYSSEQIIKYWERLDSLCTEAGIVSISDYRNDFILCRCMWSLVRMQRWPKIQAWRYDLYKNLLEAYLQGDDLTDLLRKTINNPSSSLEIARPLLNKTVTVTIDRPLGTKHPKHAFIYEVNYGYIQGIIAPDGEDLDVYILGVEEPLQTFEGVCIAIVHRNDDNDDKLIVVPKGVSMSDAEIISAIHFQEQWFNTEIFR